MADPVSAPTVTSRATSWSCLDWKQRAAWSAALLVALLVLFHELLISIIGRWASEPQYSHGFAIPLIAVALGWYLKDRIPVDRAHSDGAGIVFLATGCVLHVISVYLFVEALDCIAFLLCLTGGVLLIWGRALVLGVWPALAFLAFMFPLPFRIERLLSAPLQQYGAEKAAWYIQLFGVPAVAKGSLILMEDHRLGVAEACSGMRMLTVFFAISTATIIVTHRTAWEKVLIFLSAIPIALFCNVSRIVATALAYRWFGAHYADLIFHDLSGWLMMPAAMLLLFLLLRLLDWTFQTVPAAEEQLRMTRPAVIPGIPAVAPPRT